MQIIQREFEALHNGVVEINPMAAGSLGKITRVRAAVEKALDEKVIVVKQWRSLIDELALLHAKALASVEL